MIIPHKGGVNSNMYQPRPDFTPSISAIIMATQDELMACVQPCKMEGMAWGMATCSTSCLFVAPSVRAASKYSLPTFEMPVSEATVTANHEPRAIMNTAPPKRDVATTIMIGIHVEVGIGPKNLIIGSSQ